MARVHLISKDIKLGRETS